MTVTGPQGPQKPETTTISISAPTTITTDTGVSSIKGAGTASITATSPLGPIARPEPIPPLPGSNPGDPVSAAEFHMALGISGFETAYMMAWSKDAEESRGHRHMKETNRQQVLTEWTKQFSLINVGAGNFVKELAKLIDLLLAAAAASEKVNIEQMAKTGAVVLEAAKNAGDAIRNVAEKKGLAGIIAGSFGVAAAVGSFAAGAIKGSWTDLGQADKELTKTNDALKELDASEEAGTKVQFGRGQPKQETLAGKAPQEQVRLSKEGADKAEAVKEQAAGEKEGIKVKPEKSAARKKLEAEKKTQKKKLDELQKKRSELGTMIGQFGQAGMTIGPAAAEFMTKDDQALAQRLQGYANVLNLLMNLFLKSCESAAQNFSTEFQSAAQMEAQTPKPGSWEPHDQET